MRADECIHLNQVRAVTPSADGCEGCLKRGGTWVHLRPCETCGHVGCCDQSKNKHATKHFHAWVIPEQAAISEVWKVFDESGVLKDKDLEKRLKEVGRQVARFAYLHTSEKAQEFLRAWEGAPVNPGGSKD